MIGMRQMLVAAVACATCGTALAAAPATLPVSGAATTAGVATLELIDPLLWSGRSVSAGNGVYFSLCDRGSLRPCSVGRGAVTARRQAVELALTTFRDTAADLVVVGLPQTPTRHVLLVFERDLLSTPGLDPLRESADRLYAMGGLVAYSETEDSLVLVRLRP
ncbi:MAG: hypothetical protein ABIR67_10695 [Gaiellaceae bacterium]